MYLHSKVLPTRPRFHGLPSGRSPVRVNRNISLRLRIQTEVNHDFRKDEGD